MPKVDHLVLPVRSLDVARGRLTALGFTVAADASHPFGTGNACVFIGDGTYLEPLAVLDIDGYRQAIADGNMFTARDRAFRQSIGEDGFSALALASQDAQADHARFAGAGLPGGDMLEFSRPAKLPDGSQKLARFRLAFAGSRVGDSFSVFTCQRLNPLPSNRDALERHGNGVLALSRIVTVSPRPQEALPNLQLVLDVEGEVMATESAQLRTGNATLEVVAPSAFHQNFGANDAEAGVPLSGLTAAAVVFRVGDLAVTRAILADNDVAFVNKGGRILVAAAPGQGVVFAFEE